MCEGAAVTAALDVAAIFGGNLSTMFVDSVEEVIQVAVQTATVVVVWEMFDDEDVDDTVTDTGGIFGVNVVVVAGIDIVVGVVVVAVNNDEDDTDEEEDFVLFSFVLLSATTALEVSITKEFRFEFCKFVDVDLTLDIADIVITGVAVIEAVAVTVVIVGVVVEDVKVATAIAGGTIEDGGVPSHVSIIILLSLLFSPVSLTPTLILPSILTPQDAPTLPAPLPVLLLPL